MLEQIKSIHESNWYGTIVECGTGCTITDALMKVAGASKTIYESKQPYSKKKQQELYGVNWARSVSKEFIQKVLEKEFENKPLEHNFVLATSFQLGEHTSLAHGWIGVKYLYKKSAREQFYHFSFPFAADRERYLNTIQKIAIDLLANNMELMPTKYLDIFDDSHIGEIDKHIFLLKKSLYETENNEETFLTFEPLKENRLFTDSIRFEDLVRDKKGIILQKGSYNPLHEGHIDMMEHTKVLYPDYANAFLISINKYDKPLFDYENMLQIIYRITYLGYTVIICKKPLFSQSEEWIRQRWENLEIIFPVGVDTINRIANADHQLFSISPIHNYGAIYTFEEYLESKYWKTKFIIYDRKDHKLNSYISSYKEIAIQNDNYQDINGISSTKIREGKIQNSVSNLKKYINNFKFKMNKTNGMKEEFDRINKIAKIQNNPGEKHLLKLIEEVGELTQAINKTIGLKKLSLDDNTENIKANIHEEIADSLQCLLVIADYYGMSYEELITTLSNKNDKWLVSISPNH